MDYIGDKSSCIMVSFVADRLVCAISTACGSWSVQISIKLFWYKVSPVETISTMASAYHICVAISTLPDKYTTCIGIPNASKKRLTIRG